MCGFNTMENRVSNFDGLAIQIDGLTKYYGKARGIEDLSLSVEQGVIHGFLGPNGAGKTTTIRILVGLLTQTSGTAFIYGNEPNTVESKKRIGYLPSDFELYKHHTVKSYLDYIESLRGKAPLRDQLTQLFDVDTTKKTAELSRGNKQKIAIVQSLMHEPDLLIADEPTTGLDPLMQEEFNKFLKDYVANGHTVFFSSHILAEVQEVCDHVSVIKDGTIVSSGSIDELLMKLPKKAVLRVSSDVNPLELAQILDVTLGDYKQGKLTVYFNGHSSEFTDKLRKIPEIKDFTIPEPNLEEYFLSFYRG